MVRTWLEWLATLPAPWLYITLGLAACAENIVPPLPADTVVALGAFLAARGPGSAVGVWLATMVGNVTGAMLMFALGRRVGTRWLSARFPQVFPDSAVQRLIDRVHAQGIMSIAISRFLPGLRAVVPPVAGALRISAARAGVAMTAASGIWYAVVCGLAYRAGGSADALLSALARQQRVLGLAAGSLCVVLVGAAWWRARRSR